MTLAPYGAIYVGVCVLLGATSLSAIFARLGLTR
jgi:hypothetical protein